MSEKPTSLEDLIGGQEGAAHSIYSPSGSAMWLRCLGSLIPNVLSPDKAGWEAAEGTVAHDVADVWQKAGYPEPSARPDHLVGTMRVEDGHEIEITEEMLAYVEEYLAWCEDTGFKGLTDYSEERVDTSLIMPIPNQGGTADRFALGLDEDGRGVAVLTDLKYGKGVPVYCAEDMSDNRCVVITGDGPDDFWLNGNTQVLLYMIGVFLRYDWLYGFERIIVRICQPRLGYFGVWETNRRELLRFMQFVMDRAPGCLEPDAPRTPGPKQCQFCRIQTKCSAFLAYAEDLISGRFAALDGPTGTYSVEEMNAAQEIISDPLTPGPFQTVSRPRDLAISDLEKILPMRRVMEKWFEEINSYLTDAAVVDEAELRIWKVVESRTNRQHIDDAKSAEFLVKKGLTEDEIWTTSIISPAQAEEALHKRLKVSKADAKAMLEGLVVQPPGNRTLALRTDNRPELAAPGDRFVPIVQPDEL